MLVRSSPAILNLRDIAFRKAMSSSYASIAGNQAGSQPKSNPSPAQQINAPSASSPSGQGPQQQPHERDQPPAKQTYQPDPTHLPQTGRDETASYVLTLHTTPQIHDAANALRQKYFPKQLNKTPAHITLFHALPGSKLDGIRTDLSQAAAVQKPFKLYTGSTKRLKRGVAILVKGTYPAKELQTRFKESWYEWLSQQDRGGFQGHYTVMNKVEEEEVIEGAIQEIEREFRGAEGMAQGLTLWKYEKGRWRFPEQFAFGGA